MSSLYHRGVASLSRRRGTTGAAEQPKPVQVEVSGSGTWMGAVLIGVAIVGGAVLTARTRHVHHHDVPLPFDYAKVRGFGR